MMDLDTFPPSLPNRRIEPPKNATLSDGRSLVFEGILKFGRAPDLTDDITVTSTESCIIFEKC